MNKNTFSEKKINNERSILKVLYFDADVAA